MDKITKIKDFCQLGIFSKNSKKAQGISINVIIIAAIALLVLVILATIFIGRLGGFAGDVGACENKGGSCVLAEECTGTVYGGGNCPDVDEQIQVCCLPVTT